MSSQALVLSVLCLLSAQLWQAAACTPAPTRCCVHALLAFDTAHQRSLAPSLTCCPLPVQFKTVKPSGERVLVKLGAQEKVSSSGILLPTASESDKNEGEIVALGEGKTLTVRQPLLAAARFRAVPCAGRSIPYSTAHLCKWHAPSCRCTPQSVLTGADDCARLPLAEAHVAAAVRAAEGRHPPRHMRSAPNVTLVSPCRRLSTT